MKIEFKDVTKQYGRDSFGVENANLQIEGGVFGLLGRNGAGKTTLMRLLATIISPTSGQILFDGMDLRQYGAELRKKLGYLPQSSRLQPGLTVYEFMNYIAMLKEIKDKNRRREEIERCLEIVGLQDEKKKKLGAYSGGMLRRAGIAQAILGDPELIIVDEPTTGLDPEERLYFRNFISRTARDKTVVLSTHIIGDIENICPNIGILDKGRVIYNGGVEKLVDHVRGKVWESLVSVNDIEKYRPLCRFTSVAWQDNDAKIRYIADEPVISSSERKEAVLEDAYLDAIGGVKR